MWTPSTRQRRFFALAMPIGSSVWRRLSRYASWGERMTTETVMLSVPDASQRILADVVRLPIERVPLLDALARVLATPIVSPVTLPPWTNSAMDGYAVRADDIEH